MSSPLSVKRDLTLAYLSSFAIALLMIVASVTGLLSQTHLAHLHRAQKRQTLYLSGFLSARWRAMGAFLCWICLLLGDFSSWFL